MDHPQKHIDAAADSLRAFVRHQTCRLLCFEAPAEVLPDIVTLALAFEHHADNSAVFLPIPVENLADPDGAWASAITAARDAYAQRRDDGAPLELLGALPIEASGGAAFSLQLHDLVCGVSSPAEGMVAVLSLRQPPPRGWTDQLKTMIRSAHLESARYIVCGAAESGFEAWSQTFKGPQALFHAVVPPPPPAMRAQARDPGAPQAPPRAGAWPPGVLPPPLPRGMRADPRLAPPPRPRPASGVAGPDPGGRDPVAGDEVAAGDEIEAPPRPPDEVAHLEMQAAADAMANGEGAEAIRLQTRARDRYLDAGMIKNGVEVELVLGGYLVALGQPRLAAQTLRGSAAAATGAGEHQLAIKAYLQQAAAFERDDDLPATLKAYRQAIETSTGVGDAPVLAMEAYWRAGQAALGAELDLDAVALWGDAVAYASKVDPNRLRGSQAKPIAKELSAMLVVHRRYSQAREIERLALEFP